MKRQVCMLLSLFMLFQCTPGSFTLASGEAPENSSSADFFDYIIDHEAEFIASCQLPGGAIAMQPIPSEDNPENAYKVVPYFSNLAAVSLLEKPSYAGMVKKYMDWYFNRLNTSKTDYNNVDGTIYDYFIAKDKVTETPTGKYDSTDSYAATFFSLLRKYVQVTGDSQYLLEHQKQLDRIGDAMLSTFDRGLTYAKPDFRIQYLMDNAEVYKGLEDAVWIYDTIVKNIEKSKHYLKYMQEVKDTIQNKLWDESTKSYAKYRNDAGMNSDAMLAIFYPDAAAQLFPIWEEILPPDDPRATGIYNTFCKNFPGWPEMKNAGDFPWAIMAYTAAVMGDKTRVETYLKTAKEKYIEKGHPYPWYNLEAGMTLLAASKIRNAVLPKVDVSIDSHKNGAKITGMPFDIYGSSANAHKVEISIMDNSMKAVHTLESETGKDGKWKITIPGILNGDYTVSVKPVDRFNNYCTPVSIKISLDIHSGDKLTGARLDAERRILRRGEKTKLKLEAFVNNSNKPAESGKLKIKYMTDMPELVDMDGKGTITLKRINKASVSLNVWAEVILGNNLVRTNKVAISISREALTLYDAVMDTQAKWMADCQLANGAFPVKANASNGKFEINPLAADYTAMGLLARPEYAGEVMKYLNWHLSHLNWPDEDGVLGTVHNYTSDKEGKKTAVLSENTTAAVHMGSFISLVRRYGDITGDYKVLGKFELACMTGSNGMIMSQDMDGLFWQKPGKKLKKLDENAIVLKGLKDGMWLFKNAYLDADAADDLKTLACDPTMKGFEKVFLNSKTGCYYLYVNEKGKKGVPVWNDIRQAVVELQVITNGIVSPDSMIAKKIYNKFNASFPDWYKLKRTDYSYEIAAYASTLMKDKARYEAFFNIYKQKYIDTGIFKTQDMMSLGIIMLAAEKAE